MAEDIKADDATIKLKDGAGWNQTTQTRFIAFNTKDDFSDLPNRNLSPKVDSVNRMK